MSTITSTHPVIRLEVSLPLDPPVLVKRHERDSDILATAVEWRYAITDDPDDYRFGGYETVTAYAEDHDNFTYYEDTPLPAWVPTPFAWDALRIAARNATGR